MKLIPRLDNIVADASDATHHQLFIALLLSLCLYKLSGLFLKPDRHRILYDSLTSTNILFVAYQNCFGIGPKRTVVD